MSRLKVYIQDGWQTVERGEAWIALRGSKWECTTLTITDPPRQTQLMRDMAAVLKKAAEILESK